MKPYRNWDAEGELFMDAMDILEEIHRETLVEIALRDERELLEPGYTEKYKKVLANRALLPNGQKSPTIKKNIKKILQMRANGITNREIGEIFHCHKSTVRWTLKKIKRDTVAKN